MPLPPPSHLVIEGCTFLLAIGVLGDAARSGRQQVATLLTAMAFGLLVELHFVTGYAGYRYGAFLVEVGPAGRTVPLWVALGWGSILHAAMRASDRMGLPWTRRPAVDALLALSLDLSIEPAALARGWWRFAGSGSPWGAPLDNFIGWMLIVGSFSLAVRAGQRLLARHPAPVALAVPLAAFGVAGLFMVLARVAWGRVVVPLGAELAVFVAMLLLLLAVAVPAVLRARPASSRPWPLTVVPGATHTVCLTLLWVEGGTAVDGPVAAGLLLPLAALSLLAFRHRPGPRTVAG